MHLPGRGVPNVLRVSALELRDPVLVRILSEPRDAALSHTAFLCLPA